MTKILFRESDMRTWTLETGLNIWYTVHVLFYKIIVSLGTLKEAKTQKGRYMPLARGFKSLETGLKTEYLIQAVY